MDVSEQPIIPAFMCRQSKGFRFLTPDDGATTLSRNVDKKLSLLIA
jgi:hypothetical protein